ncbi:hypothetical protein CBR_g267 [Chara braunii]|uniref:Uncharacterized protein n=1 Tax=Chara braunii TaxID=69332 RepID=A0A388JM41_CHABU|nr:hypothetical protein CBR_g267 [Chara braunii]|eukprot:GBG58868.1 hypothetical protein CBR_g267 [Chara braunii]
MMAMEAAIMQDAAAAAAFEEEETPLEMVRMHRRQMEDIYAALIQHRHNVSPELLEEGEELFVGWEEIHANLSLQRLGTAERAQVMAELRDCTEMIGRVRGIFVELWEGLYENTRREDSKRRRCVGFEERQVPCATTRGCVYEADDVCTSATSANKEAAICREELEEGQGACGELEERLFADDEDCSPRGGGAMAMCDNNSNNNNCTDVDGDQRGEDDDNNINNNINDGNKNNNNDYDNYNEIDGGYNSVHDDGNRSDIENTDNKNDLMVSVQQGANIDNNNYTVRDGGLWACGKGDDHNINSDINKSAGVSMTENKTAGDDTDDNSQENGQSPSPFPHPSFLFSCWSFFRIDQGYGRDGRVIGMPGKQEDCVGTWEVDWRRVGVG